MNRPERLGAHQARPFAVVNPVWLFENQNR